AGDATITQVSDGQGRSLYAKGAWNTDPAMKLEGVRAMPSFGGLGRKIEPAIVSNRAGALTHTIRGRAKGKYAVNWLGGGYALSLESVPASPDASDTLVTGPGKADFTP